jgi:hypothetical protein
MEPRDDKNGVVWFCMAWFVAMSVIAVFLGVSGCQGVIETDDMEVATFELVSDPFGALQMTQCVDSKGERLCNKYPNPNECEALDVTVLVDASTFAFCTRGEDRERILESAGQGIPILCQAGSATGCIRCVDVHGHSVLDQCPLAHVDDTQPADTPVAGCTANDARIQYAEEVNKILADEGVHVTYQPDLSEDDRWDHFGGGRTGLCTMVEHLAGFQGRFQDQGGEVDYCRESEHWGTTCRCGAISHAAMWKACQLMLEVCEPGTWEMAMWREVGRTSSWLSNPTYRTWYSGQGDDAVDRGGTDSNGGSDSSGDSGQGDDAGNTGGPDDDDITCTGSPLVLDLEGDGLAITSVRRGVHFNLLGHGRVATAWVKSDDALLALDRNGNGRIDDGSELFGEAQGLGGVPARDGFQALSRIDDVRHGGNQDGVVDGNDWMFRELRLWNDRNRDGISQPKELRSLPEANVQTLHLSWVQMDPTFDVHGNDLSMQGCFQRTDGSLGIMIDVLFVFRSYLDGQIARALQER